MGLITVALGANEIVPINPHESEKKEEDKGLKIVV